MPLQVLIFLLIYTYFEIVRSRNAYQSDKLVAESARKIEAGETVAPRKMVELDHATWLVTLGEGFGKQQYR